MKRVWINQPSTRQDYHQLHGQLGIYSDERQVFYPRDGATTSLIVARDAVSDGWPDHLLIERGYHNIIALAQLKLGAKFTNDKDAIDALLFNGYQVNIRVIDGRRVFNVISGE